MWYKVDFGPTVILLSFNPYTTLGMIMAFMLDPVTPRSWRSSYIVALFNMLDAYPITSHLLQAYVYVVARLPIFPRWMQNRECTVCHPSLPISKQDSRYTYAFPWANKHFRQIMWCMTMLRSVFCLVIDLDRSGWCCDDFLFQYAAFSLSFSFVSLCSFLKSWEERCCNHWNGI